ncbi:MAG: zeta toxin family protein [Pyrinomonadaceae bacterium]
MSDANPHVIIIAGANGAGKSTLAPFLLRDTFGLLEYVNADTIAMGLSAFNPESVAFEAGRAMLSRLHDLARQRKSFAFESTLATRSYAPWVGKLLQQGYNFHLLYLWLGSVELAIERVAARQRIGGHGVPEVVIRRRYQKGLRNFFKLYQPLAATWVVYDNSGPGNPLLVAAGSYHTIATIFQKSIWQELHEVRHESGT